MVLEISSYLELLRTNPSSIALWALLSVSTLAVADPFAPCSLSPISPDSSSHFKSSWARKRLAPIMRLRSGARSKDNFDAYALIGSSHHPDLNYGEVCSHVRRINHDASVANPNDGPYIMNQVFQCCKEQMSDDT